MRCGRDDFAYFTVSPAVAVCRQFSSWHFPSVFSFVSEDDDDICRPTCNDKKSAGRRSPTIAEKKPQKKRGKIGVTGVGLTDRPASVFKP